MKGKYQFVAATSIALLASVLPSNAAVWSPPEVYQGYENTVGIQIVDSFFNTGEQVSKVQAEGNPPIRPDGLPNARLCLKLGVAPCADPNQTLNFVLLLPACTTATQQWCIESLSVRKKDQPENKAAFIRQVDSQLVEDVPGDTLPGGSSMSLWRAEGMKNSGNADTYAAYVVIKGNKDPGMDMFVTEFSAMIFPYSEKRGFEYERAFAEEAILPNGALGISTRGVATGCAWTETGLCGVLEDFPSDSRASLTLRISNQLTGWLMGRMADPTIEVSRFDTTQNKITIDAEPVKVPKMYVSINRAQVTPAISRRLPQHSGFSGVYNTLANLSSAFEEIEAWKDAAKDTAAGVVTTWSAATIKYGFGSPCLSDRTKLLGVVTTNAMVYEGNAPRFENGTLNYQVGGMHFNPDGSVFQGSYDLVMRKTTAQCLYGFSDAPITATVTVVDAGKEERIETSSLQELGIGTDKWLKLSARGFTFSSPTLKIKLNQDKPAAPAATPAQSSQSAPSSSSAQQAATAPKVAVKKSITCVKGKITRKVVGTDPKCPAGFKKR